MKVLEVDGLQTGIQDTLDELKQVNTQLKDIQQSITEFIALGDAFTGKTAEAIFSFYQMQHILFLKFTEQFFDDYQQKLKKMQTAVHSFEPHQAGYIKEEFVDFDVPKALGKVQNTVHDLTTEANDVMQSIADIVALTKLDPGEFDEAINQGQKKRMQTMEGLYALDAAQAKALGKIETDLKTMKNFVQELQQAFPNPAYDIPNYNFGDLTKVASYGTIFNNVYKEEIEANLKAEESIWAKGWRGTKEIGTGIGLGVWDVGKETVTGLYQVVRHPIQTGDAINYALDNPGETLNSVTKAISDSYERDMVNGNAQSRAHWVTYAIGSIAGTKGVTSAAKTGTTLVKAGARKAGNAANNAIQRAPSIYDLLPYNQPNFAFAGPVPHNAVDGFNLKEQLIMQAKQMDAGKTKSLGKGEQILDKVQTYEQARNKALNLVGDLGPNSSAYTGTLKSSAGYGKVIGRQSADGKVRWRLDFDPQKGTHINIEDFRNGKGINARKFAIPFEGDESTFKSLLKHLNK